MSVELDQIPSLVHQMLRLGLENNSTLLFASMSKYFCKLYNTTIDEEDSEIAGKKKKKN